MLNNKLPLSALADLIDAFTLRKAEVSSKELSSKLAELRNQIDKIDDLVFQKMAERMQVVEKIGNYKKDNNITILQVSRWDEILQKRTSLRPCLKINTDFTEKLLELMHSESIRKQTEIMSKSQAGQAQKKLTHA
jgi:chorismate mutase